MAKSRTRKKYAKKVKLLPEETAIVNMAADYIKTWTEKQLARLHQNRDTSICIPTKTGYRIGLYKLNVYPNQVCELVDSGDNIVHVFHNKIHAILYTVYTIKHKYNTADEILSLDTEINKNYTDIETLRKNQNLARQQRDYFGVDVRTARLDVAQQRLELAKLRMATIQSRAKFNKVWQ